MDLTNFVDIIGYEGSYKINKNGDVWSCYKNKIMKQGLNHYGYYCITIGPKKNKKTYTIHRLIALNFIPNDDITKNYVDHIDGIITNNDILNLRWTTNKENTRNQISKNNYISEYIRKDRGTISYLGGYPVYIDNIRTTKFKRSKHRYKVEEWVEKMKKEYPNPYTTGRILDI